jgi:GWxTD domain-containing protein
MRNLTLFLVTLYATGAIAATDPAAAVATARRHMAKREYAEVVRVLTEARPEAESISDPAERTGALSAIHFLSAVALSELGKRDEAETELRSFFRIRPGATITQGSFPAAFTKLFDAVRRDVAREIEAGGSFDGAYPGFAAATAPSKTPISKWGMTSVAILLATENEKAEWGRLQDDVARAAFVETFWKKRDPHPATEINEFREEVERRIAFADVAFDEDGDRHGALSDRGRVFVLIGKPHRVTTRPLTRQEATSVTGRGMRGGGVEVWEYRHEQLPVSIPTHAVEFRFVSSGRDPRRTMQRDFMPLAALDAARKAIQPSS